MGRRTPGGDLLELGIAELGAAYRKRTLSPLELVRAVLDAVERDERGINAFVILDREGAEEEARRSGERYRDGTPLGPLDGVPVSIKDLVNVAGWPTRRGSLATEGEPVPAADSPVTSLLRAGGSPIIGKTTTSEFGWAPISDCAHTGRTLNPRAPERSAGGSSSGAAAQVASGWGPLAIGSDAGGSVRVPASYCGLVGFKPSWGAIPQAPQSALGDFSHLGPLTRNVDDCALAMQVLSAPDLRDPASLFPRAPLPARDRPLRIGWAARFGTVTVPEPAIEEALGALVAALGREGFEIEEVDFAWAEASDALWQVWTPRIYESFGGWPEAKRARLDPRILRVYEHGRAIDLGALNQGRIRLRDMATRITEIFSRVDLLLTPTTPTGALLPGELAPRDHPWFDEVALSGNNFAANPYCYPFNVTQQPAISLPLGEGHDGLPLGVQIVGRRYRDHDVLDFARTVEAVLGAQG